MEVRRDTSKDTEYFTVVFQGDVRKIEPNPLFLETQFGKVVAMGLGDYFDYADKLEEELEALS